MNRNVALLKMLHESRQTALAMLGEFEYCARCPTNGYNGSDERQEKSLVLNVEGNVEKDTVDLVLHRFGPFNFPLTISDESFDESAPYRAFVTPKEFAIRKAEPAGAICDFLVFIPDDVMT